MNKNPQVDEFMAQLEHPLKSEMEAIREIILATDGRMTEAIKWGGPTFNYKRNLATINPKAKKFVNLFFQNGATIHDESGLLEGDGKAVRVIRFVDMVDIEQKKDGLQTIVKEWIRMQEVAG